jgi:proteasome assembly chaperone (PAC2) family protein
MGPDRHQELVHPFSSVVSPEIIRIGGGAVVEPEASRAVEECLARIRQLEEENAQLREAARTFGDLAERLKRALDDELSRTERESLDDDHPAVDPGAARLAK